MSAVARSALGARPARPIFHRLRGLWLAAVLLAAQATQAVHANDLPEYRLKAAFVFNFMAFTDWPAATGSTLTLCILGRDPFGTEIDGLQGKAVAGRSIAVQRKGTGESLKDCQAVFIAASAVENLPRVLDGLKGQTALTLADSPGAMRQGVALNMAVTQGKVSFEANLVAARASGLNLSSRLLRLATEVLQ